jgi:large subunit ribosomal protein L40
MAPASTPLFQMLTPLLQSFRNVSIGRLSLTSNLLRSAQSNGFSTGQSLLAPPSKRQTKDLRITLIRYHLQHSKTPRPLRFSRMRSLRHWTIHRAWMLHRRKRLEKEEAELYRYVPLPLPFCSFFLPRCHPFSMIATTSLLFEPFLLARGSFANRIYRMYQSMHAACEELRTMDPPGSQDAGRLYRVAMEKKGVFRHGGVPIEYARLQTDTPAEEPWNHGWTR